MPLPSISDIRLPLLRLLSEKKSEIHLRDASAHLSNTFNLTEEERAERIRSGDQKFHNRVEWAKQDLKAAGLLEATRLAHFKITEEGEKVLDSSPKKLDNNFLKKFSNYMEYATPKQKQPHHEGGIVQSTDTNLSSDSDTDSGQAPDEAIDEKLKKIEQRLAGDILKKVLALSYTSFEHLIIELLKAMKYGVNPNAVRHTGQSGDEGVDGVIYQDALGLERIYVQAKRYKFDSPIGPNVIREFAGSLDMRKAAKGLFVTTSSFTKSAVATKEGLSKHIILVDGPELAQLMIRYNVGCRVEYSYELKKLDEGFFENI